MTPHPPILLTTIFDSGRARSDKNYGDLSGLKESIQSLGSIHPITLSRRLDGSGYDLVAGGRRTRAMRELGISELHHGSVLNPAKLGYLFEDEVPLHRRKEAELDENLHRLGMDWIDDVLLVSEVHTLKSNSGKWGYRQTAELLGKGFSKSNVALSLVVAGLIRAQDKEILACENLYNATQLLIKRKEDIALAENRRRAQGAVPQGLTGPPVGTSFIDAFTMDLGPKKTWTDPLTTPTQSIVTVDEQANETEQNAVIPLSRMFFQGDCIEVMKSLPPSSFHHVVTDIPYGIDMDNLTEKGKDDVAGEHEVEANVELMLPFLTEAFRVVKPGGYCIFWYDLDHHEKLQTWALEEGWTVQRWPLTWVKTHNCRNNCPGLNYTKATEVALVLRKDSSSTLRKPMLKNYWIGDGSAERSLYNNKFAKPSALWKELIYDAIAFPGQSVFDPFVGEGSASRAAAQMGLLPYGVEINPKHFNRLMENMKAVYALIHASKVAFT